MAYGLTMISIRRLGALVPAVEGGLEADERIGGGDGHAGHSTPGVDRRYGHLALELASGRLLILQVT